MRNENIIKPQDPQCVQTSVSICAVFETKTIFRESRLEKLKLFFKHFSLRLSERYNIFITFEEYVNFCNFGKLQDQVYIKKNDGRA